MGKDFESEIRTSLRYYQDLSRGQMFFWRLYDWYDTTRKIPPRRQPADFYMIRKGVPYLIECKSTKLRGSYPFAFITDHQLESLLNFARAGGKGLLLIKNVRHYDGFPDRVYVANIEPFDNLRRRLLLQGRKSVKWNELQAISKELVAVKRKVWRLASIWEPRTLAKRF